MRPKPHPPVELDCVVLLLAIFPRLIFPLAFLFKTLVADEIARGFLDCALRTLTRCGRFFSYRSRVMTRGLGIIGAIDIVKLTHWSLLEHARRNEVRFEAERSNSVAIARDACVPGGRH